MNPIIRNILAVIAGCIAGATVNIGLINLGHIIAPLEGVDPNDMETLAYAMPDAKPSFFIFPFLAHAIGTMVGAAIATIIAANYRLKLAMGIGALFLIGGIMAAIMIPAPTWFVVLDLLLAYIPMAYLGYKLALIFINKD